MDRVLVDKVLMDKVLVDREIGNLIDELLVFKCRCIHTQR